MKNPSAIQKLDITERDKTANRDMETSGRPAVSARSLVGECAAETLGTFILVIFGCGSVAAAVLTKAQNGLWQVAVVWGFAVTLAIYATGAVSGAHINPAVTISVAIFKRKEFPAIKVLPYMVAQLVGGFLGGALLYLLFKETLVHFETVNHIVRGGPGSQLSAMMFGEYFPNPAVYGLTDESAKLVPLWNACLAELTGTAFLVFFIFALTEKSNAEAPRRESRMTAFFIGFTVAIIISIIAPLTQAALNPARDFGPRLFSYLAGWGSVAIPGPRGGALQVYVLSPVAGGIVGGFIHTLFRRFYKKARAKP